MAYTPISDFPMFVSMKKRSCSVQTFNIIFYPVTAPDSFFSFDGEGALRGEAISKYTTNNWFEVFFPFFCSDWVSRGQSLQLGEMPQVLLCPGFLPLLLLSHFSLFPSVPIVKSTWGQYADNIVYVSDVEDSSIPTIASGVPNTERGRWR